MYIQYVDFCSRKMFVRFRVSCLSSTVDKASVWNTHRWDSNLACGISFFITAQLVVT